MQRSEEPVPNRADAEEEVMMAVHRFAKAAERVVKMIESQSWLDKPSYKIEHGLALTSNLLGEPGERLRTLLHGTWLGHPLHPALTDVPIGAWTVSSILDVLDTMAPESATYRKAARTSVGIGLLGALGAAATGLSDWQYTHDNARRLALAHGALNGVGTSLFALSWVGRKYGNVPHAKLASALGYLAVQASAFLGGMLVFGHRLGVSHADCSLEPREFTAVMAESELVEGQPQGVEVSNVRVVVVRSGDRIHALGDECAHLGGPLSEGWVYRDCLVCPWHGSRFELATGRAVRGPATAPVPTFECRVTDGRVEIRRRPPVPAATPGSVVAREQKEFDDRH